ncbi:hypothetical protein RclHR1_04460005 [Rhizophagus clarus]|uniref:F-box domain-containing protein n=1 Tax=Rhizophagus clarus TaxID=94130 RepID=A0A2Z6RV05_9GLOM|nr:hypothetical protein RclHR1_04460005 [Rhizophagus clarus]
MLTIQNVPPEIFVKFCIFLTPEDLFTLSQVCRRFRGYLFAQNSFVTQQIWKDSRLQFMPQESMAPPEGMSEEKYVALLMTERGCQICKQIECKIYWEFEIRCCENCFSKKTSSLFALVIENKYPYNFLSIMPCVRVNNKYLYRFFRLTPYVRVRKLYYWKEQVDFAYSQYCRLSGKNLQSWLGYRKQILDSSMKFIENREFKGAKFKHAFHDFEEEHSNILNFFNSLPQPPPSDLPSYPLRLRPKKRVHRLLTINNNEETNSDEEVKNDFKDIPLFIQSKIQDILDIFSGGEWEREEKGEWEREEKGESEREEELEIEEDPNIWMTLIFQLIYSNGNPSEEDIEKEKEERKNERERKREEKRKKEGERKRRYNFIESERKKNKGKFYKGKNFKNKLPHKYG